MYVEATQSDFGFCDVRNIWASDAPHLHTTHNPTRTPHPYPHPQDSVYIDFSNNWLTISYNKATFQTLRECFISTGWSIDGQLIDFKVLNWGYDIMISPDCQNSYFIIANESYIISNYFNAKGDKSLEYVFIWCICKTTKGPY